MQIIFFSAGVPAFAGPAAVFSEDAFIKISDKAGPAVVNIDVRRIQKDGSLQEDLDLEFKAYADENGIPLKGAGSGFLINSDGYIVTNDHVIKDAQKINVTLMDGRRFEAKLIGRDPTLDLALIKIEAKDLPVLILGDSGKLKAGQWVMTMGNPYQLSNSVSVGIISALGRDIEDEGKNDLIQTDAAINPGNSGGPLINLAGEVVGINTAMAQGGNGIGFAIPVNDAKEVLQELIKNGKVIRPWLGINMRDIDENIAALLETPFSEGVVITDVSPEGPAAKAGMRKYDIIRKAGDADISRSHEVSKKIRAKKPGDEMSFQVYRDGRFITLSVKLEESK